MPTAILKYKLPEEKEDFLMAQKAIEYSIALEEIQRYLRHLYKYTELSEEKQELLEEIRDKFVEVAGGLVE